ncbi:GNAT family N-acetyltransferase [Thalassococcus sp. S3]|uniref:GNAT family N-acetyltransferase n=1 Tax=Thalassococcus sp. S3 TaxID=2017482 RepID=UPI0010242BCA|nr:GNAT family N-acetyltransferase [Thalassococcus sp. S3]QBF32441.1 GNAT family N-acetyltransferase [Thalassococcus sp. S3]
MQFTPHPITLTPLSRNDLPRVSHIIVAPDQVRFSGTVREAFEADEADVDFHGVFADDHAVGFFKIDRRFHKRMGFAKRGELGLRAFLIDLSQQGKGYATAAVAALPAYLPRHYPKAPAIVLTVNMINPPAIACYRKGGFRDTGQVYPHGQAGPQHVMRMRLGAT